MTQDCFITALMQKLLLNLIFLQKKIDSIILEVPQNNVLHFYEPEIFHNRISSFFFFFTHTFRDYNCQKEGFWIKKKYNQRVPGSPPNKPSNYTENFWNSRSPVSQQFVLRWPDCMRQSWNSDPDCIFCRIASWKFSALGFRNNI